MPLLREGFVSQSSDNQWSLFAPVNKTQLWLIWEKACVRGLQCKRFLLRAHFKNSKTHSIFSTKLDLFRRFRATSVQIFMLLAAIVVERLFGFQANQVVLGKFLKKSRNVLKFKSELLKFFWASKIDWEFRFKRWIFLPEKIRLSATNDASSFSGYGVFAKGASAIQLLTKQCLANCYI